MNFKSACSFSDKPLIIIYIAVAALLQMCTLIPDSRHKKPGKFLGPEIFRLLLLTNDFGLNQKKHWPIAIAYISKMKKFR